MLKRLRQWWSGNALESVPLRVIPLHDKYPEILHWAEGDEFDFVHYKDRAYIPVLISITEDGWAYCWDSDHRVKLPVRVMVGKNNSLQDRECEEELKRSNEYMQLIEAFNASVQELKERDKKLKLAS